MSSFARNWVDSGRKENSTLWHRSYNKILALISLSKSCNKAFSCTDPLEISFTNVADTTLHSNGCCPAKTHLHRAWSGKCVHHQNNTAHKKVFLLYSLLHLKLPFSPRSRAYQVLCVSTQSLIQTALKGKFTTNLFDQVTWDTKQASRFFFLLKQHQQVWTKHGIRTCEYTRMASMQYRHGCWVPLHILYPSITT